jgi:hypothetical protein
VTTWYAPRRTSELPGSVWELVQQHARATYVSALPGARGVHLTNSSPVVLNPPRLSLPAACLSCEHPPGSFTDHRSRHAEAARRDGPSEGQQHGARVGGVGAAQLQTRQEGQAGPDRHGCCRRANDLRPRGCHGGRLGGVALGGRRGGQGGCCTRLWILTTLFKPLLNFKNLPVEMQLHRTVSGNIT